MFNKPKSAIETVNDIDGEIVNFFRVLRERPEELAYAVSMTPYARDVFDDAHENRGEDSFDSAYRFAIRSKMGHGFKTYQKTGFKVDVFARERSYCVGCWNRLPADLMEAAARLKEVQIENRPALDLIKKFNHENVLIYVRYLQAGSTKGFSHFGNMDTQRNCFSLPMEYFQSEYRKRIYSFNE